jgi:hypothetical protein
MSGRLECALLVGSLLLELSCKGDPSPAEMNKLIDQRLAERGLAPLPIASSSATPDASTAHATTKPDAVADSTAFLARLDELMRDFKPDLPVLEDKSDLLRCMTSSAIQTNPDARKIAAALKGQKDAARRERVRKEREFYNAIYPLAFHYDLDWATRKTDASPPTFACWSDTGQNWATEAGTGKAASQEECRAWSGGLAGTYTWKERSPGHPPLFRYSNSETPPTQAPELMRRLDAGAVKLPVRFACRVEDVVPDGGRNDVRCTAGSIRVSGTLPSVNVGDVVSVPLANTKRDPEGVLFKNVASKDGGWVVDADGSTLTVDAPATCPALDQIVATLTDAGGKQ